MVWIIQDVCRISFWCNCRIQNALRKYDIPDASDARMYMILSHFGFDQVQVALSVICFLNRNKETLSHPLISFLSICLFCFAFFSVCKSLSALFRSEEALNKTCPGAAAYIILVSNPQQTTRAKDSSIDRLMEAFLASCRKATLNPSKLLSGYRTTRRRRHSERS